MARKKIRINLTDAEYNILNRITRKTKTDCWFMLDKDKDGFDCVRDLENKRKVTLRFAVQQLSEAIIPELLDISVEEMFVFSELLNKLDIKHNPFYEAIETCPHCDGENVYPMWDVSVKGYVAVCQHCGKEIFLCDECMHSDDNEAMSCDWCKTDCGGKCFRGITRD